MAHRSYLRSRQRERTWCVGDRFAAYGTYVSPADSFHDLVLKLNELSSMQPAYVPADGEYTKTIPPPSFLRWIQQETASPMELLTGGLKKFSGPTLVTLRIMVQNRRTDGRIFAIFGEQTRFSLACDELKEYVLPEERDKCSYQTLHG